MQVGTLIYRTTRLCVGDSDVGLGETLPCNVYPHTCLPSCVWNFAHTHTHVRQASRQVTGWAQRQLGGLAVVNRPVYGSTTADDVNPAKGFAPQP